MTLFLHSIGDELLFIEFDLSPLVSSADGKIRGHRFPPSATSHHLDTNAAGRTNTDNKRINVGDGTLGVANAAGVAFGGATAPLTPGVYTFGSDVNLRLRRQYRWCHRLQR
jgi:hypothetical protein